MDVGRSHDAEDVSTKPLDNHQHLQRWSIKMGEGVPAKHAVRSRFASTTSTCSTLLVEGLSDQEDTGSDDGHALVGQVWVLSQDLVGCRQVQEALDAAPSHEAREVLAEELHGHVLKAMRCPHANHVLQKCIALLRPDALQFIVDELLARDGLVVQAAKHRYACRIVQHMLSKCPSSQMAELVEVLMRDAVVLACHSIGHYSVQRILDAGTEEQRYRLIRTVERNVRSIGQSSQGG